jgi:ribonuclease Z
MPTRSRGLSSIALEREGELLLFDCGEGTQRQMIISPLSHFQPDVILISHAHADHLLGLPGLLMSMGMQDRRRPVKLIGPGKVVEAVGYILKRLGTRLSFQLDCEVARPGLVHRGLGYRIRAARAEHPGEAYSFRLDEDMRPGRFYPERASRLEIPRGPLWHRLQKGRSLLYHGRKVTPEMVLGPPRPGRSFGYSGDTRPASRLVTFFRGVDLLAFDSTYSDAYLEEARAYGHSTASEAATLASKAGVRLLLLTHISPRVTSEEALLLEANREHQNVIVAKDFLQLSVPLHT